MPLCYFCSTQQRPYLGYFCEDCSLLRRMLIVYDPTKAIEILKRTLIRDQNQIDIKIDKILKEKLPVIKAEETDEEPEPKKELVLRNKKKIIHTLIIYIKYRVSK